MLQLDEIIGRGGFGTVYRGTLQTEDGLTRRVAVKVLSEELSEDAHAVARLRDEARLLALLDHPALVPVYSLQLVDQRWAVVMGLVEGVDLRELMRRGHALPARAVCEIGAQVADALDAMWQQPHPATGEPLRVVHRDIKPHNLMLDAQGRVRMLDLGVASARFAARESTTRGGVAGTLAYMSPQRWGRMDDQHQGDVYAVGAALYHLVTGQLPPEAAPEAADHARLVEEALTRLPEAAAPLAVPIRAALSYDLATRPDAAGLADLLRAAVPALPEPSLREFAQTAVPEALEERRSRVPATGESLLGSSWDPTPAVEDGLATGWIFQSEVPAAPAGRPASPRTRVLARGLAVAAAFGALAVAVAWWSRTPHPTGPVLRFGAPPILAADELTEALAPLEGHLEAALARPVDLVVAASYGEALEQFARGAVDVAMLTPLLYVQAIADEPMRALAMTDPVGLSGHEGVLLVAPDVVDLEALRGATICFTDPNSTSGYLLPRRYLRKNGLVPDRDYTTHLSGGHAQAVRDLAFGKCRAAGTYGNAFFEAARRGESYGSQVFARTGLAAHNTVACAAGVPEADCDAIREALLSFHPGGAGSDRFRITGFVAHDPAAFDELVEAWREEAAGR